MCKGSKGGRVSANYMYGGSAYNMVLPGLRQMPLWGMSRVHTSAVCHVVSPEQERRLQQLLAKPFSTHLPPTLSLPTWRRLHGLPQCCPCQRRLQQLRDAAVKLLGVAVYDLSA